jgi:hypothetical protein
MQTHPTDAIAPHPLLKRMPMMPDGEFEALAQDIGERGIEYPIQVVKLGGDVVAVDGRHRLRAAAQLGLTEVPVVFREADQAADIIIGQLVHRRHYPKGVIAYLVFPMLPKTAHGGDRKSRPIQSVLITKRVICRRYGFSEDLYDQAADVHEKFSAHPDLRDLYEPMLLAGEIGLGRLAAGLGGAIATKDKKKVVATPEKLIEGTLKQLEFRWAYWDKLGERQRRDTAEAIAAAISRAPEDVRVMVAMRLGKKGR